MHGEGSIPQALTEIQLQNPMTSFTFISDSNCLTFEAATYSEALAALIFAVGSEAEAALYRVA